MDRGVYDWTNATRHAGDDRLDGVPKDEISGRCILVLLCTTLSVCLPLYVEILHAATWSSRGRFDPHWLGTATVHCILGLERLLLVVVAARRGQRRTKSALASINIMKAFSISFRTSDRQTSLHPRVYIVFHPCCSVAGALFPCSPFLCLFGHLPSSPAEGVQV